MKVKFQIEEDETFKEMKSVEKTGKIVRYNNDASVIVACYEDKCLYHLDSQDFEITEF